MSLVKTNKQGSGLIALKYELIYDPINLKICTKNEKKKKTLKNS